MERGQGRRRAGSPPEVASPHVCRLGQSGSRGPSAPQPQLGGCICSCRTFHGPRSNRGHGACGADGLPMRGAVSGSGPAPVRWGRTSVASSSGPGSVVLGCREEPFHLDLADLRIPGCSASIQREKGPKPMGSGLWGLSSGLAVGHQALKSQAEPLPGDLRNHQEDQDPWILSSGLAKGV